MCCQLFQLEEAIKSQKQVLSNLESDLQRELNPNQTGHVNEQQQQQLQQQQLAMSDQPQMHNETPETLELRNEVNYSREQTRLQCKQLHDLDMRMKQNEQSLMAKEQQLQQLLEELYIQEIYADNALETAITGAPPASTTATTANTTNFNMSTFKLSNSSPNSSIGQLMLNKAEEQQQQQLPNDTVDSFENDAQEKMVELIINERNSFNNSSIDFIQQKRLACLQKQQQDTFLVEEHHKRHIRMFGDNDDLLNANLGEVKHNNNSNKPCGLNPQHKSLSFGNLTNQTNPTQQVKPKPANLNHSLSMKPSYQQAELIAEIHNHTMSTSIKNLKLNNGLNANAVANGSTSSNGSGGDHSGGDNDSGISSMSSETAATMGSNPSGLTSTSSFHQQYQKPIIMSQYTHNTKHMMPSGGQMFSQPYSMTQMSHQQYQTNQYHQHRAPYHQAHHTNSSTNVGNTKSVLETLV